MTQTKTKTEICANCGRERYYHTEEAYQNVKRQGINLSRHPCKKFTPQTPPTKSDGVKSDNSREDGLINPIGEDSVKRNKTAETFVLKDKAFWIDEAKSVGHSYKNKSERAKRRVKESYLNKRRYREQDIFEKIKEKAKPKVSVSVTIDSNLRDKLEQLKKKENIETLSPIVNALLWDWFKQQEKQK